MLDQRLCQFLKDLADDINFKGKLIIDVTEKLFFSFRNNPYKRQMKDSSIKKMKRMLKKHLFILIKHYNRTGFLDKENFTPNPLIDKLPIQGERMFCTLFSKGV